MPDRARTGAPRRSHNAPSQRNRRTDPSRGVAYDVLRAVSADDAYANLLLPVRLRRAALSGRDAAFTTELTYGTLRGQGFYDAVIADAAGRGIEDIDPDVRDALRLGAHQLLAMRVPTHAAVDSTVALVRDRIGAGPSSFANAVLRRISERPREEWEERVSRGQDELAALAITGSHPRWILRAFGAALGAHGRERAELPALVEADNRPASPTVAALPDLSDPEDIGGEPGDYSPYARRVSGDPAQIPAVSGGRARVQDEGSQLVALALTRAPLDGEDTRWLDLCAGPGGKSALLAAVGARRSPAARLTAVEVAPHRAELVRAALAAGSEPVEVLVADGTTIGASQPHAFDRVLVDVPCTGLGALRRRPEARWRRSPKDLPALAPLQRELLNSAVAACRPGGIVAYTTCSPHLAESLTIVDDAVGDLGLEVLDAPRVVAGLAVGGHEAAHFASARRGSGAYVQLWPHVHGTDAMFLALLRVPGGRDGARKSPDGGQASPAAPEE